MTDDALKDDQKLYGDRDPMEQGDWFIAHMHHLTTEDLYSKAAIAEELAHRDIRIETLEVAITKMVVACKNVNHASAIYISHIGNKALAASEQDKVIE